VKRRRGGSGFGGWSREEQREADLFFSELLGQPASHTKATETEAEFMPVGRWTGPGREPFYGDEPDERWKVVAYPGSRIDDDLRDDDLVVYRSFRFRGSAWRGILVADLDRDSLFREGTDRLRGDAVILRRVLVRPAPVTRVSLPPGRGDPDEGAEDQTAPPASVCARDVAVNDTMALLIAGKAPLPVSKDEIKRAAATAGIRDDYKSVAAVVPATAERRLLIFFHGNGNYVTAAPTGDVPPRVEASGHSRVPRWVSAAGRARIIGVAGDPKNKGVAAAQIKYGFLSLAASQQALAPADSFTDRAVKNPLVLVPENAEVATGSSWAVPPGGQYGTASDGKPSGPGTKRLEELVLECYEHLRCLRNPSNRPYLAPDMSQRASWVSNIQRTYVVGHSGGGKPLVEAAGADMLLITPSSVAGVGGRAVDLWLFDCTYNFREADGRPVGVKNYVNFCTNWHNAKLLGHRADSARFVCVYGPKTEISNTETLADSLRTEIAAVLKVSPTSLLKLHDSNDMSSQSMIKTVIPALTSSPGVIFVRTNVTHDLIPTRFTPLLLRTAAS
jgi:hypothetical protein